MASRDNYIVFLRPDIGPEAVQLFSHFVRRVEFKTGATLDYLACSSVTTDGPLVELTVYPPESEHGWPFQIPHYMVLAISGPIDSENPIRFITGDA
jgi:hypothetical protein